MYMEKIFRNKRYIYIFIMPAFLIFAVTFLIPILQTLYSSFFKWDGITEMKFIGVGNYLHAFTKDDIFWPSVTNTFLMVAFSLGIQLPLSFLFAYMLNTKVRGATKFRKMYFIPCVLSTTIISLMWTKIYEPNTGLLNDLLRLMGLAGLQREWLSDDKLALASVFITITWQFIGYHMLIMYAGLKNIPKTYYEAAQIDGAGNLRMIWNITLPLMSNVLKVDVVLAVIGSLKVFDNVYIMTGGGPYNSSMTLAIWMYKKAFGMMHYGYGSALAILLIGECLMVTFIINKLMGKETIQY